MKRQHKNLEILLAQFVVARITSASGEYNLLGNTPTLSVLAEHWQLAANIAKSEKWRFVALWARDGQEKILLYLSLECGGEYLILQTNMSVVKPQIASIFPVYPIVNRLERHTHDMLGIDFLGHPDGRRWTRHQAWRSDEFPLRKNFVATASDDAKTPADSDYPFLTATGVGTCEVPVGPIHAGIIEPGHFRFQIAGEDVLNLEERLGYVHKGIEKIAENREMTGLMKLAGRVSGDSTVGYAWATAAACENALNIDVLPRAVYLRAIMAERERVTNHLGDFAAICNDVGFAFPYYQFMRLKEIWLRVNAEVFGHRLLMDKIVVGGVNANINMQQQDILRQQNVSFACELTQLYAMIEENSSLHDRLKSTGVLAKSIAEEFGCLGYVGKASGHKFDVRHAAPYPPYNELKVVVPSFEIGDVLARTRVRAQEALVSLDLLNTLLDKLPDGDICVQWLLPHAMAEGVGIIEGWRGEIFVYVCIDATGKIARFYPRDPSWFSWPALEKLIDGNIVPDFPVCNKSVNGSYSGVDL